MLHSTFGKMPEDEVGFWKLSRMISQPLVDLKRGSFNSKYKLAFKLTEDSRGLNTR